MDDHAPIGREPNVDVVRNGPLPDPETLGADAGLDRCGDTTRLTASECATLSALPATVDRVLRRLACELGAGHDGWHLAFTVAAHGGDQWWWLCWAERLREVVQIDPCDSTRMYGFARDCCLLPCRHPGPHSFEVRAGRRLDARRSIYGAAWALRYNL